ncbi:nicotinate-nucleotide--dimethylbenzimidazole phosphoribosyltransferase [Actinacidiphila acidipaludis]|uniref:Nicotinate-nucleotide--dimethylbenzimidazole phosphoribosyltransferase n=1 Tax=Actinacidiphila acidipaludis TaxID=2873382 RepID=A0ABS7Q9I3_9ACTN|nr:nicotinate-nucleotide--dimethylbenzimidazole phosphoribosyltransferase [Streptomyces acidipaludis]MBY8879830.1 nicotinate-nucleotide--dimethylbenzimidazole phosphoribosyltransferase [Streptomyces acidipaludis]
MTDTGQIPGEGLPENGVGDAALPPHTGLPGNGVPQQAGWGTDPLAGQEAPGTGYTYLDQQPGAGSGLDDEDDALLMPGSVGAWSDPQPVPAQPQPHLQQPPQGYAQPQVVNVISVEVPTEVPVEAPVLQMPPTTPRRPLHMGPPVTDTPSGGVSVRSLSDRGPAVATAGPPTAGPEYLDVPRDEAIPAQQTGEPTAAGWPQAGGASRVSLIPHADSVIPAQASAPSVSEGAGIPSPTPPSAPTASVDGPQFARPEQVPAAEPAPAAESVPVGGAEVPPAPVAAAAPAAPSVNTPAEASGSAPSGPVAFLPGDGPVAAAVPVQGLPGVVGLPVAPAVPAASGPADAAPGAHAAADAVPAPTAAPAGAPATAPAEPAGVAAATADAPQSASGGTDAADAAGSPAAEGVAVPAQDGPALHVGPEAPVATGESTPVPAQAVAAAEAPAEPEAPAADAVAEQGPAPVGAPETVVAVAAPEGEAPARQAPAPEAEVVPGAEPGVTEEPAAAAPVVTPAEPNSAAAHGGSEEAVQEKPSTAAGTGRRRAPAAREEEPPAPPAEEAAPPAAAAAGVPQTPAAEAGPEGPESAATAENAAVAAEVPAAPARGRRARRAAAPAAAPPAVEPHAAEQVTEAGEPVMTGAAEPAAAEAPVVEPPVVEVPAVEAPDADAAAEEAPTADGTASGEPVAEVAAADEPAVEAPAEAEPAAEVPATAVPVTEVPVTEAPAVEEPVAAEPAAEPSAPEPAAPEVAAVAAAEPQPAAEPYDPAVRDAVHRVIRERRDIRNGFRSDPIPHEVLLRVLEAAHTAPSVGHSQPWDFVVIRSEKTRERMHQLAMAQREAYAKSLPKARARQFRELKIEAILDTPVNIVVTADPTRGGRHTLGRHTQPQMAPYSSALAVENLWLAARAEGLGVGWVSFFDERQMVEELGLPEHLEVVAYLCVGYVDEFPEEPELMQAGWSQRRPLSWVVHEEEYGNRALPGEAPHDLLDETLRGIRPLDAKALGEAWERQKRMTKPAGALGMLEIISAQLSGLSRQCPPPIPEPAAVAIFAGDHGVHAQGVTAWPQEVTGQMVANFLGGGAVCNAFANQVGAEVCVIDVGVASELPSTPGLLPRKVRPGTADFTTGPAMTRDEALRAIEVGIETARDLVAAGNKALLTGEMGIANTTTSAALIAVFTGVDPAEVTGRGTGINDEMHARKVEVVRRALELHQPDPGDPIAVLTAVGGLEHAAMVGLLLGAAALRTPVILDGVSAGAAALVARAIAPEVLAACIAGHRSAEPGHMAALTTLGLRPLVDLDLRLGEGTGALLALPLVQSAARVMHEVATFDAAGVTEKS